MAGSMQLGLTQSKFNQKLSRNHGHETYLSAKPHQARTYPRFSRTHGNARRSQSPECPACQRPRSTGPLIEADRAWHISDRRFPRTARLLSAADYRRVFDGPRRSADRWFTVLAVTSEKGRARLGLAISKKQARRAVDRNRLKRLIRETFRDQREQFDDTDLVVMARTAALSIDNAQLRKSLARHFTKLAGPMRARSHQA